MLFNSFDFFVFFVVVYFLFLTFRKHRWFTLLLASYFFYMSWKWEYIILIILSTFVDYISAQKIASSNQAHTRKFFLGLSIGVNLSILFFFKYFEFFLESVFGLTSFAQQLQWNFLLPVGISFYTFQTMSYTIDVYNGKANVETHLGKFALFVTYFPQLVAGPIERASHLMHQLKNQLEYRKENLLPGAKIFVFGLFKKVVIADRLALLVDPVYNHPETYGGYVHILATVFFAFQIYCDFSGYSDMAIGISRMFNVKLMKNFNAPYFAHSISNFWQRWHISLSTWFRDYVYIPLGGNRGVKWRWYYNLLVTFLVSGLWHGANWTFVIWGAFHGIVLILEQVLPKISINKIFSILSTFILANIGWVLFRANNLADAGLIFQKMLFEHESYQRLYTELIMVGISKLNLIIAAMALATLLIKEALNYELNDYVRILFYIYVLFMIIIFGIDSSQPFIYFQF